MVMTDDKNNDMNDNEEDADADDDDVVDGDNDDYMDDDHEDEDWYNKGGEDDGKYENADCQETLRDTEKRMSFLKSAG